MKTIRDHVKVLLKYWREYYTDGGFPHLYDLKVGMIEHGICPRCGERPTCSGMHYKVNCWECGFKLTDSEWHDLTKGRLRHKLRTRPPKDFKPFNRRGRGR